MLDVPMAMGDDELYHSYYYYSYSKHFLSLFMSNKFLTKFLFRLHAQALTLAALAGAAVVEYYDHKTEATNRYPKFLPPENLSHKDL